MNTGATPSTIVSIGKTHKMFHQLYVELLCWNISMDMFDKIKFIIILHADIIFECLNGGNSDTYLPFSRKQIKPIMVNAHSGYIFHDVSPYFNFLGCMYISEYFNLSFYLFFFYDISVFT